MKAELLTLSTIVALLGCDAPHPKGDGWKVVGHLTDGLEAQFVEVTADRVQDRATYDSAIRTLCQHKGSCVLGFFSPGDRVPRTQGARDFFAAGGWRDYPVLATWWSTEFTTWDCTRAGVGGAPTDALCGAGVSEAYSAILSIGSRAGMAEACRWPSSDGPKVAMAYIGLVADPMRKDHFQQGYDRQYSSGRKGPDKPDDCKRLRSKIEEANKSAVDLLRLPRK